MIIDNNPKELFEFIRTVDTKNTSSLKSILSSYEIEKISIEHLLDSLKNNNNILLLDARSEKEFEESAIPFSYNFPVLTNFERHNVGLIYKKYSQSSALWLAMQYADPKSESLKEFLSNDNAAGKTIYVYCWRGGGRSSYLSKLISDLGYKSSVLTGGHKSFRKKVNDLFSQKIFPYDVIELSGLTGCGKTELLKSVSHDLSVIDLEEAARHYSSLLGHIPYEIKNYKPVQSQTAFENNIYSQIYFNSQINQLTELINQPYLIESESKKVGRFDVPGNLYKKMESAPAIQIIGSMENRIKRIIRDYFGDDLRGIILMKRIMLEKSYFFKQQLSNSVFNELINFLDSGKVYEFTEIMITEYYDKKYKDKGKKPVTVISTDDINKAKDELIFIYNTTVNNQ
ncbi:MAG: tRNA 2-selenouridine(34) synthase MnmH [Bacteroidota bacterium]|nr:tRNA 2-selenouridine(34) synthase MnmH [Bacteroidota bacterium]